MSLINLLQKYNLKLAMAECILLHCCITNDMLWKGALKAITQKDSLEMFCKSHI